MRWQSWLRGSLLLLTWALPVPPAGAGGDTPLMTWKKTVVDKGFHSEGVAIADVNRDGKLDLLAGDVWYEAPAWITHQIRPVASYGDGFRGYSQSFACWADDFNGDGWPDVIILPFPGQPCYWYENPKGQPVHWKPHLLWHSACNETPQYVDLFGTGKRVLVMGWQPKGKDTEGQMAWFTPGKDPTQPWEMHPISEPSQPGREVPGTRRFAHGLGVGDLNGDGRLDVMCTGGWWEQPAYKPEGQARDRHSPWKFHPANLGEPCADMFAYDMDGDGKADVISTSAHKFGIWWHQQRPGPAGSPTFLRHDLFKDLVSETHAVHCVDLNGDGLKDLVTGKRWWSHGRNEPGADMPAVLYWFEARRSPDGLVRFVPHVIDSDSGIGTQFVVDDLNGDGLPDVVTANKKGVFVFEQVRGKSQPTASAGTKAGDWTPLFNGKDLTGWETWLGRPYMGNEVIGLNKDPKKVYTVTEKDGRPAIHISGEIFGALTSKDEFENYHLRLEFKWGEKKWPPRDRDITPRDSGLLYHCVGRHGAAGNNWMQSLECQIQEKDCGDFWSVAGAIVDVEAVPQAGSPAGLIVFRKGGPRYTVPRQVQLPDGKTRNDPRIIKSAYHEKPNDQWNTIELLTVGSTSVHLVNGQVNMVLTNARRKVGDKEEPLTRGKIQLQSEGAEIFYRNIAIRPLKQIPEEYLK